MAYRAPSHLAFAPAIAVAMALAARPAWGAPLLGGEIAASEAALVPVGAYYDRPALVPGRAAGSSPQPSYFAAWTAVEAGAPGVVVWGARFRATDASLIDLGSFVIRAGDFDHAPEIQEPATASGLATYLAVWKETPFIPRPGTQPVIRAAIISQDQGASPSPLHLLEVRAIDAGASWGGLAAAFDAASQQYLIVWQEDFSLYGRWVTESGSVIDAAGDPIPISGPGSAVISPALDCGDDGCLAVWKDFRSGAVDFYAARVDAASGAAAEVQSFDFPPDAEPGYFDVAADGASYLLAWSDGSGSSIQAALVNSTGEPLDPGPPLTLPPAGSPVSSPNIARTGPGSLLLAWDEQDPGWGQSAVVLSTAPSLQLASPVTKLPGQSGSILGTIACAGGGAPCAVVSVDPSIFFQQLFWVRASLVLPGLQGSVTQAPQDISARLTEQLAPAAACGRTGDRHLVVWREQSFSTTSVRGAWVSSAGGSPLALAPAEEQSSLLGSTVHLGAPAVASGKAAGANPDRFLVAWIGDTSLPFINTGRVALLLLDDQGVRTSTLIGDADLTAQSSPAVASDSAGYLVVWNAPLSDQSSAIFAARVSAEGAVVEGGEDGTLLAAGASPWTPPSVVHDGAGYLIVWQEELNFTANLIGMRVGATGSDLTSLVDPFPITSGLTLAQEAPPGLASDGEGNSLVVWREEDGLRAARVNSAGTRLDQEPIELATGETCCPRVTFDGSAYLVTWKHLDAGLRGAWIPPGGAVTAPQTFDIAGADDSARSAALASCGEGRTIAAFTRTRFEDAVDYYNSERVRARLLGDPCAFADPPVVCAPAPCRTAGACDPWTLTCAGQVPEPDGTPCDGGLCFAGTCVPDPPGQGGAGGSTGAGSPATPADPAGCACRAAGASSASWSLPAPLAALIAGLAMRRRARRARRPVA